MRMTIANNIKATIPNTESVREYMKLVKERSQSEFVDKSSVGTLMDTLTTIKFDGSCTMHKHVIEMIKIATKLKSMGMEINDNFLVHFIINSLPPQYVHFKWVMLKINGMCMNCIICSFKRSLG